MNELNYQIYDEISGLAIPTLTDECVRMLASKENKNVDLLFNELKNTISQDGVNYIIPLNNPIIIPIMKPLFYSNNLTIFKEYEQAVLKLQELTK